MSLDWPPTGTSILLDIIAGDASARLGTQVSRVQAIDDRGLTILPPHIAGPAPSDLSGAAVLVRWNDPDNGSSLAHGLLGPVNRSDRRTAWHVTITTEVTRTQRRRFVRELMPGTVVVTQPRVRTRASSDTWTANAGLTLRGTLIDLGEGGARFVTDQAPFLDLSTPVRAEIAPVMAGQPVEITAEVLRIERGDAQWTLVLQFPETYPHMRAVRALVFAAMRERVRVEGPGVAGDGAGAPVGDPGDASHG